MHLSREDTTTRTNSEAVKPPIYGKLYRAGTFLGKLFSDLEANGMSSAMAHEVMKAFTQDQDDSSMALRWFEDPDHYPSLIYHLQWRLLCTYALRYIDANAPKAWFRPVFLPPSEMEAWLAANGAPPTTNFKENSNG